MPLGDWAPVMPLSAPMLPPRGTESIWAPMLPCSAPRGTPAAGLPAGLARWGGGGMLMAEGCGGHGDPFGQGAYGVALGVGGLWGGTRGACEVVPVTPRPLGPPGAGGGSVGWPPGLLGRGGGLWGGPQNPGTPRVGGSGGWPPDLSLPFRATCVRGSPDSNRAPWRRGKEVGSAAFERGRMLAPGRLGPPSAPKGRGVGMGPNADTGHPKRLGPPNSWVSPPCSSFGLPSHAVLHLPLLPHPR